MSGFLYQVRLMQDENYKVEYARALTKTKAVEEVENRLLPKKCKIISVERLG